MINYGNSILFVSQNIASMSIIITCSAEAADQGEPDFEEN